MAEGGVLLSSDSEVYFGVNAVGAIVWDLLPKSRTVEELVGTLSERFSDVGIERIDRDVRSFISDLRTHGLVIDEVQDGADSATTSSDAS